jgi:NADH-quinone oxidoreductase subunit K
MDVSKLAIPFLAAAVAEVRLPLVEHYLLLGAVLFSVGMLGVVIRRNALTVFMSIELMLNAANLTFLSFARVNADLTPHAIAILVMAVAAAEAAIGLAIVIAVFRVRGTTNVDEINAMKN